jgi:MoxR-like ATPase
MEVRKIKTKLVGKESVFNILALSEATGLPVLLLGEPGVGKTQTLLDYAAAKYQYNREAVRKNTFVIELDEGTKTSEIKGRVNMKSLLEDKEYKIDAPIADAKFLLINEVDKGTSGVRNTLLSVMREKALFYGDTIKKCKWEVMAGSCNVIPNDELENPFWDRFVLTEKVVRVGLDVMKSMWKKGESMQEVMVTVPSKEEVDKCKIDDKLMAKFLTAVYTSASDRTIYQIPRIVQATKLVYSMTDSQAIIKVCELVAPDKLGEVASKLETKRENNVRSLVSQYSSIVEANNWAYTQLFTTQLVTELNDLNSTARYKDKASELLNNMYMIIGEYFKARPHSASEIQAIMNVITSKSTVSTSDKFYLDELMQKIADHGVQA